MQVRLLYAVLVSAVYAMGVMGCSDKTSSAQSHDDKVTNILRVDVGAEAPTLDPTVSEDTSSTRIMYDLFSGLVDFDQENNPIPGMSVSWDVSPDGKLYTFHLRKDLKFSDGAPITARDFVYSWQRLVDPKTGSPYGFLLANVVNGDGIMRNKLAPSELGISAPDDYTFVVHLVNAEPEFLSVVSMPNLAVVPQHVISKFGGAWTAPEHMVTSGAYMLKEHVVNGYILAVKNPYYYDEKNVAITQVRYLPYVDTNVSLSSYRSDGVDTTWQTVPVDQYEKLKKEYPEQLRVVPWEMIEYFDFNMKQPKFANNKKLRQALSMAIDREVLTKSVIRANSTPLYSNVTETIEDDKYAKVKYDWESWPRAEQIAMARKLYAEAGYNASNPLEFTITYNTNDLHKKVCLTLAAMWKDVLGANVKAQNQEWKTFIQSRHKGDYDMVRDGWVADFNSVTAYTPLLECNGGQNNAHYCNPEYDKLLKQAVLSTSESEQQQLYAKALKIALDDYPSVTIYQGTYQVLVKPYVNNYQTEHNYLNHVQSKWMTLDK